MTAGWRAFSQHSLQHWAGGFWRAQFITVGQRAFSQHSLYLWAGGLSAGTVYNSGLEGFPLAQFITSFIKPVPGSFLAERQRHTAGSFVCFFVFVFLPLHEAEGKKKMCSTFAVAASASLPFRFRTACMESHLCCTLVTSDYYISNFETGTLTT